MIILPRKSTPEKKLIGWVHDGMLIVNSDRGSMKAMRINSDGVAGVWSNNIYVHETSFYLGENSYPIYEGDEVTLKF